MASTQPASVMINAMSESKAFLNHAAPVPGLGGPTIGDFWRWAYSDILSNTNRSVFAEYIVGVALGAVDTPRIEWDSADLRYQGYNIEVKASADLQSWHQRVPSPIRYSIRKATYWNQETGACEGVPTRNAHLYVFCHYPERDKSKANVLDVPAWDFYVVSTETLNREFGEAKSISLASIRRVGARCKFDTLKATVDAILLQTPQDQK